MSNYIFPSQFVQLLVYKTLLSQTSSISMQCNLQFFVYLDTGQREPSVAMASIRTAPAKHDWSGHEQTEII